MRRRTMTIMMMTLVMMMMIMKMIIMIMIQRSLVYISKDTEMDDNTEFLVSPGSNQ